MGVVGVGGFAQFVSDLLLKHGPAVTPPIRLAAACDPDPARFPQRLALLRDRGVQVLASVEELLALKEVEAIWLPVPIDLHAPFTLGALAAGKAVMCEKPAAATVDEWAQMAEARDRTGLPVLIGYQDIYDPTMLWLKRQLLSGQLGRLERASIHACWPRSSVYFGRSAWAGRIRRNGTWVLDSPVQNALSHYVNLPLFLMGPAEDQPALPLAVEAELYRAAPIENYDTASLRVELEGGATLLVLVTHACMERIDPAITIQTDRGRITITRNQIVISLDGASRTVQRDTEAMYRGMLQRLVAAVRGLPCADIAAATLEVARSQLLVANGASQAAAIVPVPPQHVQRRPFDDGGEVCSIEGIESAITSCAQAYQMLHESGRLPFTQPASRQDLRCYKHFAGPRAANACRAPAADVRA